MKKYFLVLILSLCVPVLGSATSFPALITTIKPGLCRLFCTKALDAELHAKIEEEVQDRIEEEFQERLDARLEAEVLEQMLEMEHRFRNMIRDERRRAVPNE